MEGLFNKDFKFSEEVDSKKITDNDGKANENIKNQIKEIIKEGTQEEQNVTVNDVVAFLIHEGLFCSSQLIKKIKLYNPGYVIGFSFIAEAHSRMGDWCQAYDNYLKIIDENISSKEASIFKRHLSFLESNHVPFYQNRTFKDSLELDKYYGIYIDNLSKLRNWEENKVKLEKIIITKFEYEEIKKQPDLDNINKRILNKYKLLLNKSSLDRSSYSYEILRKWICKNSTLKKDKSYNMKKNFNERIKELLGTEGHIYLESKNHYETAVQYFYKMIQLHSDGKTYKDKLHEIYMLEDDYNDNMAHYTIAAERVRINIGKITKKINSLNNKITDSKVYEYDSYLQSDNDILDGLDIETINKYLDYFSTTIIGD